MSILNQNKLSDKVHNNTLFRKNVEMLHIHIVILMESLLGVVVEYYCEGGTHIWPKPGKAHPDLPKPLNKTVCI